MRVNRAETVEFAEALGAARHDPEAPQPACIDRPDEFADYDQRPTEAEATELCSGCPLLDKCLGSARKSRPDWGVRGGVVWDGGKQYHWLAKLGLPEVRRDS